MATVVHNVLHEICHIYKWQVKQPLRRCPLWQLLAGLPLSSKHEYVWDYACAFTIWYAAIRQAKQWFHPLYCFGALDADDKCMLGRSPTITSSHPHTFYIICKGFIFPSYETWTTSRVRTLRQSICITMPSARTVLNFKIKFRQYLNRSCSFMVWFFKAKELFKGLMFKSYSEVVAKQTVLLGFHEVVWSKQLSRLLHNKFSQTCQGPYSNKHFPFLLHFGFVRILHLLCYWMHQYQGQAHHQP